MNEQPLPKDEQGRHAVYSVVLIALESLLTFLLEHNRTVRQLAAHLIERQAVVEVRMYLPAETFYATFTARGVLLDFQLAEGQVVAGRVTGSFADLVRAFMSAPAQIIEKLQIEGEPAVVDELRVLMTHFNLQHVFTSWWRTGLLGKHQAQPKTNVRIRGLMKKSEQQQQQIDQLTLSLHERSYDLRQMQYRYQRLQWICLGVMVLAALGCMASFWLQ